MISASDAGRRSRSRVGSKPALGSFVVHGVALALAWVAATKRPAAPIEFVSYQIDMVAAPAADVGSPVVEAPPAAEPPAPEPTPPPPTPAKEPEKKPIPVPEPVKKPTPVPATTTAPSKAPSTATPKPTPSGPTTDKATGTGMAESINIRMQGLRRDYPAYYNNIILQIQRCFRWSGTEAFEAELYFVIEKNGSVSNVDVVKGSPNYAFNTEAMGAVECAGQPGRFGPLPDDFQFDQLPIRFTFRPGNGR